MFTSSLNLLLADFLGLGDWHLTTVQWLLVIFLGLLVLPEIVAWLALRYIPNDYVGIVEKLWSPTGSVAEGRIIALNGEAGYQAGLLRGGIHIGLWRWEDAVDQGRVGKKSGGENRD